MEMRRLILACAIAALAGCATAPVKEIATRDVVVTRTEKSVKAADVPTPPAAMPARPGNISAALDLALAKLCEYVGYTEKADPLLQNAAGVSLGDRVREPICRR
jgi:hypothetical protein